MSRNRRQSGFTLIELMIAITLVAAISAGLLTTMRNALLTMERTQTRLEENRKALGIQDLIRRQIGGLMPVRGYCGSGAQPVLRDIFQGSSSAMLLVTNESMTEGSRGSPRVAFYQVQPNADGTVRLEVSEQLFSGQASTAQFCEPDPRVFHAPGGTKPFVLLNKLAFCRFVFRDLNQSTLFGRDWLGTWMLPFPPAMMRRVLPSACRSLGPANLGWATPGPLRFSKNAT